MSNELHTKKEKEREIGSWWPTGGVKGGKQKHSNCWLIRSHSHLLNTNRLSRKHFSSYSRCYTWHYTPINTLPLAAPLPTNEYIAVQECGNWVGAVKLQLTVKIFLWRYECKVCCLDKEIKSLYWQLSTIGKWMKSAMDPFCIEVTIWVYFQCGIFFFPHLNKKSKGFAPRCISF